MRFLLRVGLILGAACLSACHLASAIDPPRCDAGTQHPLNGQCVANPIDGPTVTIARNGPPEGCTSTPDSIKVAPNAEFRFKNEDTVDHTMTGDDGSNWITAKAGELSPFLGITKVGTWRYHVSGCGSGGTVVVE